MTEEVKAEFRIGKTQWRKWGNPAREAFNKSMRLGFTLGTAIAEGNAVQAKQKDIIQDEIPEETAETAPETNESEETPVVESEPAQAEAPEVPKAEVEAKKPRKPRVSRKKDA